MSNVLTFEDFHPGTVMGEAVERFTPEDARRWEQVFCSDQDPTAGDLLARGASSAVMMMMRAYLKVVTPRPPGNIHARQHFRLEAPPRIDEQVRTVVRCLDKEQRRGRFYVDIETRGTGEGGRPIYSGRMALIWAA